jgi:TRAP-type transport system periplasmic protein
MSGLLVRAVGAVAVLLFTTVAHAATVWEAYVYNTVGTQPSVEGVVRLADQVKAKTNGELVINVHLGGSLPIKADGITAAVADGVVQFGDDGFATGTIPLTATVKLPMLIQSEAEVRKAMDILQKHVEAAYAKRGILMLGQYAYPAQVIWGRKKIESLADIKGTKLRVTSVEQGEFIRRFGGVSLTIGAPDVAAALDRGLVEGVLTASTGGGIAWHDLLKYRYAFPVSWVTSNYVVNKEAFDKLTPDQQRILRDAAVEQSAWATAEMLRQEDEYTAKFGKEGMILVSSKAAEVAEATEKMRPYWDEWAAKHDKEAQQVVKEIRAAVGR